MNRKRERRRTDRYNLIRRIERNADKRLYLFDHFDEHYYMLARICGWSQARLEAEIAADKTKSFKRIRKYAGCHSRFTYREMDWVNHKHVVRYRDGQVDFQNQVAEYGPLHTRCRKRTAKDLYC